VSPADHAPARRARARLLRAVPLPLLAVAALAACAGQPEAAPSTSASAAPSASSTRPAQESTVTTSKPTCSVVERHGERIGVTVPAGFMVTSTPDGAGGFSQTEGVNILAAAQWRDSADKGPAVVLVVYGYGAGESRGAKALDASVRNFKMLVGAGSATAAVTAKPATVAGRPGSAGGETDATAMDFQSPDGKPSPLHWWTVPTPKGEFVVAVGARDTTLDAKYTPQIRSGLKAGGC
jgi:hypothetical protein